MQYRPFGRTGVQVSVACLGTMTFGWEGDGSDEVASREVLDAALDLGVNFVDTADVYVAARRERVASWAAPSAHRRDKIVLATKCHGKMDDNDPNAWGNSYRHIVQACEASLKTAPNRLHRPLPDPPPPARDPHRRDPPRPRSPPAAGQGPLRGLLHLRRLAGLRGPLRRSSNSARRASSPSSPPTTSSTAASSASSSPSVAPTATPSSPGPPSRAASSAGSTWKAPKAPATATTTPWAERPSSPSKSSKSSSPSPRPRTLTMTALSLAWVAAQPGVTSPIIGARSVRQLTESVEAVQMPAFGGNPEGGGRDLRTGRFRHPLLPGRLRPERSRLKSLPNPLATMPWGPHTTVERFSQSAPSGLPGSPGGAGSKPLNAALLGPRPWSRYGVR